MCHDGGSVSISQSDLNIAVWVRAHRGHIDAHVHVCLSMCENAQCGCTGHPEVHAAD